ncbi:ThiF family adenylyltransferase [Egicoccus sp. AB-alg6-2]|uniref:ThiF family adenylyltransferase n=1 Tax=Egicoccus sp. AB-alg6-2 TaxID=3242692 RepID=UPI00359F096A
MQRWWERDPDRLQWELERFRQVGLKPQHEPDGDAMVVKVRVRAAGRWEDIQIIFPAFYPDAMPRAYLRDRLLPRHHEPGGNLCLFPDPEGGDWSPAWSAADTLIPRLRKLLSDLQDGGEAVADSEVPWAEPVTAFYYYNAPAFILTDPLWEETLPTKRGNIWMQPLSSGAWISRKATTASGRPLVPEDHPALASLAGGAEPDDLICLPWYAIDDPLPPPGLATNLADVVPLQRLRALFRRVKSNPRAAFFTFLEEGPARGQQRRAWVLTQIHSEASSTYRVVTLSQGQELSRASRQIRLPGLESLAHKHVAIIGAGSLGSPVAIELAKAGIGLLTIIDDDHYDVGNAVRHVLPVTAAGVLKADGVAAAAREYNPYVRAKGITSRLGASCRDADDVVAAVGEADLLIDTTGSTDVARTAAALRRSVGGLLIAGLSYGVHGGELLLQRREGPCFDCFKLHQEDGAIPRPPAAAPATPLTPVACRMPAFPGPGFSATHLAALVTRTAIQELSGGEPEQLEENWSVYDLHTDKKHTGKAEVHEACHRHG